MPGTARMGRTDDTFTVKHYLMEYPLLVQRRDALTAELDRLREATTHATSRLSPARSSGRSAPDSRENAMLAVVDAEERLKEIIGHVGEALAVRLALIERLEDERQKTLLTLRYINNLNWENIGYAMHYERTQIFEIHNQALSAAQHALDGEQP